MAGAGSRVAEPAGEGRLPVSLTPFVNRSHDLTRLRAMVPDQRLISLAGPAGTGKTRLALQLAQDLRRSFRERVWFVELAPVMEPELVPISVARAFGVAEASRLDAIEQVRAELAGSRTLLVLDNCEHVVAAAAAMCDGLLRSSEGLTIVATSRERLGVPGEVLWRVEPLGVPEAGRPYRVEELAEVDGVALFWERARRSQTDFAITADNAGTVAELVRRLDGIPLAIELAAAWVSTLSLADLLARLEHRFELLTARERTLTRRHTSLRAAIDSSYDALDEPAKSLFRRLGLFAGGTDLDSAAQVWQLEPTEAMNLVARLVDRSLLSVVASTTGPNRFRMLDSLRDYAIEKLAEREELEDARRAYAGHFAWLVQEAIPNLRGPAGDRWLGVLDAEHDNFRAVLEQDPIDATLSLTMTAALSEYWRLRGHYTEARLRLLAALKQSDEPSRERASALSALGMMAWLQGDQPTAERHTRKALVVSRRIGDQRGMLQALQQLAQISFDAGRLASARQRLERGLPIVEGLNDPVLGASHYLRLGQLAVAEGRWEEARTTLTHCLDLAKTAGHTELSALARVLIGRTYLGEQRPDQAESALVEALRAMRGLGGPRHIAPLLESLAAASAQQGDPMRAAQLAGAAAALYDEAGAQPPATSPMRAQLAPLWEAAVATKGGGKAWADGRAMDREQAIAYALREKEAAPVKAAEARRAGGPRLTRRQLEIARLVAEGLTNREIADRLYISERTAEGHLDQIRNKLGLGSRVQIAAWVIQSDRATQTDRP